MKGGIKLKILCIVQARMGSSRLYGKVMKNICGKTVLEHCINRLKTVKSAGEIIIATTDLPCDDAICEEGKRLKVNVFRGDEEDVLSRYYYGALAYRGEVIVRITSDCPLIDSEVTNKVINYYLKNDFQYVNNTLERTFPRGLDVEVFSFKTLEETFNNATIKRDREHVTTYIYNNPQKYKLGCYKSTIDYSMHRWTLDTIEDYQFISKIYEGLYRDKNYFGMMEIINFLNNNPEFLKINSGIIQKEI